MLNKNLILALAAASAMLPAAAGAQAAGDSQQGGTTATQAPTPGLQSGSAGASTQPLDFSRIPGLDRPPKVQIDLTPALLSFASAAAQGSENPDIAKALSGVRGVRVFVYDVGQDAKPVLDFIENSAKTLEREGWQRAVYVQDNSDKVRLYVKSAGSQIAGLTMMVSQQDGEAVFINVDGSLDPVMLGRLAGSLGLNDVLGAMEKQHGGAAKNGHGRAPKSSGGNAPTSAPGNAPEAPSAQDQDQEQEEYRQEQDHGQEQQQDYRQQQEQEQDQK